VKLENQNVKTKERISLYINIIDILWGDIKKKVTLFVWRDENVEVKEFEDKYYEWFVDVIDTK